MAKKGIKYKRLIIVGASGLVGKNFLETNEFANIRITATYYRSSGFLNFIKKLKNPNITPLKLNLLKNKINFSKYNLCLYLSGNSNPNLSLLDPQTELLLNCYGLLNLLKTFRGSIVFLSSAKVYQGLNGLINPSLTPAEQTHPYSISKLAAENYIRYFHEIKKIRGYRIIRLYYTYGPYENQRRLIPFLLRNFNINRNNKISVGCGKKLMMSPIYSKDLAQALYKTLLKKFTSKTAETYDLPGKEFISSEELINRVAAYFNIKPIIHFGKDDNSHLFHSTYNDFRKNFIFTPKISIEESLNDYLKFIEDEKSTLT